MKRVFPKRKSGSDRKKSAKTRKNEEISLENKRTVVYSPNETIRAAGLPFRVVGLLCRAAVLYCAVFGMALFLSDAFGWQGLGTQYLAVISGVCTLAFAIASLFPVGFLAPIGLCGAGCLYVFLTYADFPMFMVRSFQTLYNAFLQSLADAGYYAMLLKMVPLPVTGISGDAYLRCSVAVVIFLISLVDVLCLMRRVQLILPALLNAVCIGVVFIYNVSDSNWGVALLLASYAALIIMAFYERRYFPRKDAATYDCETVLYAQGQPPQAAEKERSAASGMRTLEQELDIYLQTPKKPRKRGGVDKKEAAASRQVRRDAHIRRDERLAAGGFTAMAVFAVCFLLICMPAAAVKGNFRKLAVIDEPMSRYREYVTALLQGNDPILDDMGYAAEKGNFEPHSTDAVLREFTGEEIMRIESNASTALYLRGWIGVGYQDGAWYPADKETHEQYRQLYGNLFDPSETMLFGFYRYMEPGDIDETQDFAYHQLNRFNSRLLDGYIVEQVNIERLADVGSLCYFPSYYHRGLGLRDYGSENNSLLTYVNYFDGLYTGQRFKKNTSYATVSLVMTMKNENWYRRMAKRIAAYEQSKQKIEQLSGDNLDQLLQDDVDFLDIVGGSEEDEMAITYKDASGRTWRDVYDTKTHERLRHDLVDDPNSDNRDLYADYAYQMTKKERENLLDHFRLEDSYTDFVYDTYLTVPDSKILNETLENIRASMPEAEIAADAAERDSVIASVYEQRHLLVMAIVDYLGEHCMYTLSPLSTPDASLDGVENFLSVTREGYCVQFASATALMLRMASIPARYVEGYIASNMVRQYDADAAGRYMTTVCDDNAHAWVEVWYDGVGWIPYETTPAYYDQMYPTQSTEDHPGYIRPGNTSDEEEEEEELTPEELLALQAAREAEANRQRLIRMLTVLGCILVGLAILGGIFAFLFRRAKKASQQRFSLAVKLKEGRGDPEHRREDALAIIDQLTSLLALYGSAPGQAEQRSDYVERLSLTYNALPDLPEPDFEGVFAAIAAEEFGGYMDERELADCARLWLALYRAAPKYLSAGKRFAFTFLLAKL